MKIWQKKLIFPNPRYSDLESVDIPDGVKEIGNSAFYCNHYLKFVHLPKNLEIIGEEAFDGCSSELLLNISENVREIGFTKRLDLLRFAIEHNIHIQAECLKIYQVIKGLIATSDSEKVRLLIDALDITDEFMEFWHIYQFRFCRDNSKSSQQRKTAVY